MIPFNYHHLFYFYTVARTGSISKACEKLNLAQPTISTQLKQFEHALKAKLFIREKKNLTLTDEGRHILFYAAEIFDVGREMMDGLNDHSLKDRLKIQIGTSNLTPKVAIDALLHFLYQTTPEVHISIHEDRTEALLDGLRTHLLDIAVTDTIRLSRNEEDIEHHLAAKIPVLFCVNRSLASKYKNFPEDLNGAPVIFPTSQSQVHAALHEFFIKHNVVPKIVGEIQDAELVRELVLSGMGIAPLNKFTATQSPDKKPLVILNPHTQPAAFEHIYLLTKKRKKKHPLVPRILEHFRLTS
ncbi:MAG: LysR family transcriptional regulator [Candidatus Omnitrophica bacterium]|nr:LysR family transcriptional regulator [Candidatus Omnitrophota bacterium]